MKSCTSIDAGISKSPNSEAMLAQCLYILLFRGSNLRATDIESICLSVSFNYSGVSIVQFSIAVIIVLRRPSRQRAFLSDKSCCLRGGTIKMQIFLDSHCHSQQLFLDVQDHNAVELYVFVIRIIFCVCSCQLPETANQSKDDIHLNYQQPKYQWPIEMIEMQNKFSNMNALHN